jgi:UDP-galactopyranose mutase
MQKKYDFIIVGSGFFGSICAYELHKIGKKCLVLEKRNHIGGNCYTELRDNINIHMYGPHIFHTSNTKVWEWVNQFVKFNNFILQPVANYNGEIYPLPFNMYTFSKMWNISHPKDAKEIIKKQSSQIIGEPKNLEEQSIKLVGTDIYNKLIKGYTEKQWNKPAEKLPKEIIKRLPVRFTYNNNYFNDTFQGIPIGGYSQIFKKLLDNTEVILNTDYLNNKEYWNSIGEKIIYTGPIDEFYDYKFGPLEYKTTSFKHLKISESDFQGVAMMNYTSISVPYTRCVEHKHFENSESDVTWISYEYPCEYIPKITEPYYPVNDEKNNNLYKKYFELTKKNKDVFFGGRLAEYKYYDMDKVIESALSSIDKILKK